MTSTNGPAFAGPAHLLLATDLSARCDRALDRAAQLARDWRADLTAVHVIEATGTPDQLLIWAAGEGEAAVVRIALREIGRDLAALDVRTAVKVVPTGDPATAIRNVAMETDSALVVVGMARGELLGRFVLGSIVERLARSLPQPLLVVRNRVRDAYRRIVVATDFSESSRSALKLTARLFPGCELIVYHALPVAGDLRPALERIDHVPPADSVAEFLALAALPGDIRARPVAERGRLEEVLARYVRDQDIDLVVVGSHGSSGIMRILLGSSATKLLRWLPCDTMVVRAVDAVW